MPIGFQTSSLPNKPLATSGVSTLVGVDGSGGLVNLPVDATGADYRTEALFAAASIPALVQSITTAGYYSAGDGGGHCKVRISTPSPAKAWHSQSADGAWWQIAETRTSPRMFGAKDDGTDAAPAAQGAIDYGKPVVLDGNFTLQSALTCSGGISIAGYGRSLSSLTWPNGASSGGITVTATSYSQTMFFKDFAVYVGMDMSAGKVISCSWQGLGLSDYFKTKLFHNNLHIEATGSGKFDKGLYVNFCHSFYIEKCFIQNQASISGTTAASFPMTACIYVDNDETIYNTVTSRFADNELFGATHGIYVKDVEGCWFTDNDIQACWKGVEIYNGYRKINQYRFKGNHISVLDTAIKVWNARQVLITDNELSYRTGRTDTATVYYIILDQVQDGEVSGNTIRGNYSDLLGSITLNGVRLMSTAGGSDPTNYIRIFGNGFRDLMTAIIIETNTAFWQHYGNTYNNVMTQRVTNNASSSYPLPLALGDGDITPIPSASHAALFTKPAASALAVNRDSDGLLQGLYGSRTLVGGFGIGGSATYSMWADNAGSAKIKVSTTGVAVNGNAPVGKQTLSAALSTGGSETNVNICTAINNIRAALIATGWGV